MSDCDVAKMDEYMDCPWEPDDMHIELIKQRDEWRKRAEGEHALRVKAEAEYMKSVEVRIQLEDAIQVFRDTYEGDGVGTPKEDVDRLLDSRLRFQIRSKELESAIRAAVKCIFELAHNCANERKDMDTLDLFLNEIGFYTDES